MGQDKPVSSSMVKGLEVCSLDGSTFTELPDIYTQQDIPGGKHHIPKQDDIEKRIYLEDVHIPKIDANIDLLIGANAPKPMEPWRIINNQGNGPFAIKTLLGWVVNGVLHESGAYADKQGQSYVYANRISVESLSDLLVQQFNHDFTENSYMERKEMSQEDKTFMEIMDNSAEFKDGHYQLPLPFKRDDPRMPNNRLLAEQRASSLKRKFNKSAGASLNAELIQGPNLTNTLIGVLVRFRLGEVAIMVDVKKMFPQVKVLSQHVDFLRFLWWPDGDINQPLKEYRMIVHLFGATSSSSCASYGLRQTAEGNKGCFSAEAVSTVKNNFYVDDLLKAVDSEEHAIALCKELKSLCAAGGFNLTKWISNSRVILAFIPDAEKAEEVKILDLDAENVPMERALGIQWFVEEDAFRFHVSIKEHPHTRQGILSMVSSIYDPLGFIAPLTFPAKHMLQEL
ncbi:hypothetical protein SKAU_G00020930 [Synaphobranchus kaupii]|uniref:Uncharacterized protein n=1 Tax=Synaphobranchus kaupii TaxID=118154 RepID=A0A9Q1JDV5_SYNKA|nr:hypothetical protein SKAU_G00020930 [Synaphobranchus kaupii]